MKVPILPPPKSPRPSMTKPLDLGGGEPFSPLPVGVPKKKKTNAHQCVNRETPWPRTAAIVMRQSTVFGTFAPYHITHTRQRERPNILDSFTQQVPHTAHHHSTCRNTKPRKAPSAGKNTHTDDGEFHRSSQHLKSLALTTTPKSVERPH